MHARYADCNENNDANYLNVTMLLVNTSNIEFIESRFIKS